MLLRLELHGETSEVPIKASPFLVGMHEGADLHLLGEDGVNRRHALFARYLGGWAVHDLGSINGVRHNGVRVTRADLAVGDTVRIGRALLTVVSENPETDAATAQPNESDDFATAVLAGNESGAVFAARCKLRIERPNVTTLELETDGDRSIGYSSRCDIRLSRHHISSLHCLLARDGGAWYLHDIKSERGLFYRGQPVKTVSLSNGDEVRFGDYTLTIFLLRDAATMQPGAPLADELVLASGASAGGGSSSSIILPTGEPSSGSIADFDLMAVPQQAVDYAKRGRRAFKDERFVESIGFFAEACHLAPYVAFFRKQLRQAQRRGVRREPTTPPPAYWPLVAAQWRTRRAFGRGDQAAVLRRAEVGLQLDPWNKPLLMLQAAVFEDRQLFDLALWSLLVARARNPADPEINRPIARLYHHLGVFDRAIMHWQMVAKARRDDREPEDQIKRLMVEKTLRNNRSRRSEENGTA